MEIFSLGFVSSAFKIASGVLKIGYILKHYKKQILDKSYYQEQFENSYLKVFKHLNRLEIQISESQIDKSRLSNSIEKEVLKTAEFIHFYKGEIEEKIFDLILPPKPERFNTFVKFSFFFLEGYDLLSKKYYYTEYVLSYYPWHKTALHYISIPAWPNLTETVLIEKVKTIKKITPRIHEKYHIPEIDALDEKHPHIGEAIEKVLNSGTISTEAALNLMAAEQILFVHKYAEDFGDVYKPQKQHSDELNAKAATLKKKIKKARTEVKKEEYQKELILIQKEIDDLHKNWATAPIGTIIEKYGFKRLFNNMDGVYGMPLSLIPIEERENLSVFFKREIENPAKDYLKMIRKSNNFAKNHSGKLKYIAIFHQVSISQLEIFFKERDLSISPLLSRTMFKLYLANPKNKIANLYLNDLVRNVDIRFYLDTTSKTGAFLSENLNLLTKIIYRDYKIDISAPSNITSLDPNTELYEASKKLIKESSSNAQLGWVYKKLTEIHTKYKELEKEFNEIKKR